VNAGRKAQLQEGNPICRKESSVEARKPIREKNPQLQEGKLSCR
jgi:hypothetical protein